MPERQQDLINHFRGADGTFRVAVTPTVDANGDPLRGFASSARGRRVIGFSRSLAGEYTLAHEVGHILGFGHNDQEGHVMSSPSAREPIDGAMDRRDIARARRQAGVLVRQLRPVAGLSCERFDVPEVANIGPGHPSLYRTSIQSQNSTYTGETLFGRAHGRGETLWNEGTRHTGTYVAGSRHGYGTQHFASGATYRGMFTDGERTGSGTHAYANGAQFVGDFLRGQRHGDGVYIDSSGDRFERAYVHDRPQTPEWATGPAPHTQSRNDRRPNPSVVQTQTNARAQMRTYSFSIGPIRTIRVAAQGIPLLVGGVGHNVLAPR